MSSSNDSIVLNFYEALIRQSDVDLLRGPYWLNDTIISFYFEYLEKIQFAEHTYLLFVPPDVTQCIKLSPISELGVFLTPLLKIKRSILFFVLNDNERTDMSGGSHWSLLVYSNSEKCAFHFDSSSGINKTQANELGHKLFKYFGLANYENIVEARCLQQSNGYDCGIHVLCNVENIATHASKTRKVSGYPPMDNSVIERKRPDILQLISRLRNECNKLVL